MGHRHRKSAVWAALSGLLCALAAWCIARDPVPHWVVAYSTAGAAWRPVCGDIPAALWVRP